MNAATISRSRSVSAVSKCLRSHARGSIVVSTTAPPLRFLAVPLRMQRWSSRSRTFRWFVHHDRGLYAKPRPYHEGGSDVYSGCGDAETSNRTTLPQYGQGTGSNLMD